MKKIFLLMLAVLLPLISVAQQETGGWTIHPKFVPEQAQNVVCVGDRVYYLVSQNLYCFDTSTDENMFLNKQNFLSDVEATGIYNNPYTGCMLVTYASSNIDIVTPEGRVINLPDIKNASVTTSRSINDVTFSEGRAWVATDFGYVVINTDKYEVSESRRYYVTSDGKTSPAAINGIALVGNNVVMSHGGKLYVGDKSKHLSTLSEFTAIDGTYDKATVFPLSEGRFIVNASDKCIVATLSGNTVTTVASIAKKQAATISQNSGSLTVNVPALDAYYTCDTKGDNITRHDAGGEVFSAPGKEGGELWAVGKNGLHADGDNANYYKPNGINITTIPFWMTYNASQGKLYLASTTDNGQLKEANVGAKTEINTYDGSKWEDVTPEGVPSGGNYWLCFDPSDPDTYYFSTRTNGTCKVTGGELKLVYNTENSPLVNRMSANAFDNQGNLWLVQPSKNVTEPVMALTSEKLKKASVTKQDFITPNVPNINTNSFKWSCFAISKESDVKVFTCGDYGRPIVMWKGGISEATPVSRTFDSFTDQDGNDFKWSFIYALTADLEGDVWMGCTEGVISFTPANAFDPTFTINHIKVPRNDNTNLADYLLDGQQVNAIAVDTRNRKWIGTKNSGLFLVSPDGSKVLQHFTTDNSELTSNEIYQVCCNTTNNSVYVVTPNAVLEYYSAQIASAPDYNDVVAYPNPVRPDFMGTITIKGLMENSLVKIADSAGNVVRQFKSDGGIATWDGCDANGERVGTGVYFVLMSQNENDQADAAVTKILVIK